MIAPDHVLPITTQAKLLNISRGAVYYLPKPTSEKDLVLMRHIDELHLQHPTMGARMLRDQLNRQGFKVSRRHVTTLMRKMGIAALSRQKNTSGKCPGHKIYPYLLRAMKIDRANQVWALDTTYIPMAKGFVYLTAVIDWASRKVLAAKVAITLEACHAVEVLEEAYKKYGRPQIVNVDQGSQFTAEDFVRLVLQSGAQISMDGKGSWRDNVFIERLWKTLKYDHVYLHAYESVSDAREKILSFLNWYNIERPHSSLDRMTPDEMYFKTLPPALKAA
jgi:putative transposase